MKAKEESAEGFSYFNLACVICPCSPIICSLTCPSLLIPSFNYLLIRSIIHHILLSIALRGILFKKLVLSNQQSKNQRDSAYRMSNKGSVNTSLNLDLAPGCVDGFIEVYGRWLNPNTSMLCDCWLSNTSRQHTSQTNLTTDFFVINTPLRSIIAVSSEEISWTCPFWSQYNEPCQSFGKKKLSISALNCLKKTVNHGVLAIHF